MEFEHNTEGASMVMGPGGLVPISEWQRQQRERLDQLAKARATASPPPPPAPDRGMLESQLAATRQQSEAAASRLAEAEASLHRVEHAEAEASRELERVKAIIDEEAHHRAVALHAWLTAGGQGDRPMANFASAADKVSQPKAEADLRVAQQAKAIAIKVRAEAASAAAEARAAVHEAARALIRLDAIETARRIQQLELEAGELWQTLWASTMTLLEGKSIPGHPEISASIQAPPRRANRTDLHPTRITERTAAATKLVKDRFAALVAGEEPAASQEEAAPCQQPSQAA